MALKASSGSLQRVRDSVSVRVVSLYMPYAPRISPKPIFCGSVSKLNSSCALRMPSAARCCASAGIDVAPCVRIAESLFDGFDLLPGISGTFFVIYYIIFCAVFQSIVGASRAGAQYTASDGTVRRRLRR